jgi:hypothetical protein
MLTGKVHAPCIRLRNTVDQLQTKKYGFLLACIVLKLARERWFADLDLQIMAGSRVARWHIFRTMNPNLGKFWRVLQTKMFAYFMHIFWSILRPLGKFCGHLVYFVAIM